MRKSLLVLLLSFGASAAMAATAVPASSASGVAPKALSSSQNRMVQCNKDAAGKKGDERKAFMKGCLKGTPASAAVASAPVATSAVSLKK